MDLLEKEKFMSRTLVIGDIHGSFGALIQVLKRSNFDYENDTLISLGDVCDGWPQVKECFSELLKIKNLIFIFSNHDAWALDWMLYGLAPDYWVNQGGKNTIVSYGHCNNVPQAHVHLIKNALKYYQIGDIVFVHGGIDPNQKDMTKQDLELLLWDRKLVASARKKHLTNPEYRYGGWKEIYVGHTTTGWIGSDKPINLCNIWMLDTGAGWEGKLTIMDINTKEYWQSDLVEDFYPNDPHSRKKLLKGNP